MNTDNANPPDIFGDVEKFFILAQPEMAGKPFQRPPNGGLQLGEKLIVEEVINELLVTLNKIITTGYSVELMSQLMDDGVDSVYVIVWLMKLCDLPFNTHWKKVQEANMNKFETHAECGGQGCGFDRMYSANEMGDGAGETVKCMGGKLVRRNLQTGKVKKPEGWTPVNNYNVLFEYWSAKTQKELDIQAKKPKGLIGFQEAWMGEEPKDNRRADAPLKGKENNDQKE